MCCAEGLIIRPPQVKFGGEGRPHCGCVGLSAFPGWRCDQHGEPQRRLAALPQRRSSTRGGGRSESHIFAVLGVRSHDENLGPSLHWVPESRSVKQASQRAAQDLPTHADQQFCASNTLWASYRIAALSRVGPAVANSMHRLWTSVVFSS